MDTLISIIFVCIALPLLMALALVDKKSRLIVGFIIIGAFMCVFISGVNGMIQRGSGLDIYFITTNITPMTEELIKALPILVFAFEISDDREKLLTASMAVGIGFAIIENIQLFVSADAACDLFWSIRRVFGASLMHGLCTSLVGYGVSFVRKRRKLFYTGTFALLLTAIVYHSIFNSLVQSSAADFGVFLPIVTYIPVILWMYKMRKKTAESRKQSAETPGKIISPMDKGHNL